MLQLHMKSYTFYVMEVHFMINKIKVLAADVDMTLSSKGSPLPEITIQALKELHDKNVLVWQLEEKSPKWKKRKESFGI